MRIDSLGPPPCNNLVLLFLLLAVLSPTIATGSGNRNLVRRMQSHAANTEAHLNSMFVRSTDYLENRYLDSSLNEDIVVDQDPFSWGRRDSCYNVTEAAMDHGTQTLRLLRKKEENHQLRDLTNEDIDNANRIIVDEVDLLRRKLRVWNEETGDSMPIKCVTQKHPLTVQASRNQDRQYKLLCVTFTFHKNHHRAALLNKAWGQRCHRHIFITNKDNGLSKEILGGQKNVIVLTPQGGESYANMWQKTRATLLYFKKQLEVRTQQDRLKAAGKPPPPLDPRVSGPQNMNPEDEIILQSYDYFFFGGDDVFLIPENLHKMVNEPTTADLHAMGVPLHLGYRQLRPEHKRLTSFISGAGYVLNAAALQMVALLAIEKDSHCFPDMTTSEEDVLIAKCLQQTMHVIPRDTRDVFGEDRFNILNLYMLVTQMRDAAYSWWWRDFRDRASPRGLDIMSRDSVLFHYIQDEDAIRAMAFGIYGVVI